MPRVSQEHLDARRQQIVDAARACFATRGFAGTSMTDIIDESGLSNGAIYRYFKSKNEIVVTVCEQASGALPETLGDGAITAFLEHIRTLAREQGHAKLVTQILAEAAVTPDLAAIVNGQLEELRAAITALLAADGRQDAAQTAEAFVALCAGYSQQLATRGDLDSTPFADALIAILRR